MCLAGRKETVLMARGGYRPSIPFVQTKAPKKAEAVQAVARENAYIDL